jgi:hypothetical protein
VDRVAQDVDDDREVRRHLPPGVVLPGPRRAVGVGSDLFHRAVAVAVEATQVAEEDTASPNGNVPQLVVGTVQDPETEVYVSGVSTYPAQFADEPDPEGNTGRTLTVAVVDDATYQGMALPE